MNSNKINNKIQFEDERNEEVEVDEEDDDVASEPGDLPVVTNQVKVRDPYT